MTSIRRQQATATDDRLKARKIVILNTDIIQINYYIKTDTKYVIQ